MAKIFRPNVRTKSRKHQSSARQLPDFTTEIEKYDHELKAIAKAEDGRICFISGAMSGETVKVRPSHYTERLIHGQVLDIIKPSSERVAPPCVHFNNCGGCQLQYIGEQQQVVEKQTALDSLFTKRLGLSKLPWQPAIDSPAKGYRRTARLAVWHEKDGSATIGFRQNNSKHIVNVTQCEILGNSLSALIAAFRPYLMQLEGRKAITHLQLFALKRDVLVIRTMAPLTAADKQHLKDFAQATNSRVLVQNSTNDFEEVTPEAKSAEILLSYEIDKLDLQFQPKDFIQINDSVNHAMVAQAIDWLAVTPDDRVLDLFSGVGNFTLPLAKRAKEVFAVEGVNDMVKRLKSNALLNGFDNIKAYQADLSKIDDKHKPSWLKPIDKLLLDPARDGAMAVVKKIPLLKPKQILYVSCNPATMLRDLEILQSADYHLTKIGLLNMFPHTHHVEAMALLEYQKA